MFSSVNTVTSLITKKTLAVVVVSPPPTTTIPQQPAANYTNFGTSAWTKNATIAGAGRGVSPSATGQYVLAGTNAQGTYVSTNYGVTFVRRTNVTANQNQWAAVSYTGQYMILVTVGSTWFSSDYGTTLTALASTYNNLVQCCAPGSGQYMLLFGPSIFLSSDYGVTWPKIPSMDNGYNRACAMSYSGQYIIIGTNTGATSGTTSPYVAFSSNYGASFTFSYVNASIQWLAMGMNETGQYITGGDSIGRIYIASDYYASGSFTLTQTLSNNGAIRDIRITSNPRYQVMAATGTWYSTDYGVTWTLETTTSATTTLGQTNVGISQTGNYQFISIGGGQGVWRMTPLPNA